MHLVVVGVKTIDARFEERISWILEIGRKLMEKRRKEIKKLSDQSISMTIQRGKAACISSAMRPDGADL